MSEQEIQIPKVNNTPDDAYKLFMWFLDLEQPVFTKVVDEWKTVDRLLFDQQLFPWVKKIQALVKSKKLTSPGFYQPLWLYYKHSAQIAYLDGRKDEGREKINLALAYLQQIPNYPDKLTYMLALLYHGKNKEAIAYAERHKNTKDGQRLQQLIPAIS